MRPAVLGALGAMALGASTSCAPAVAHPIVQSSKPTAVRAAPSRVWSVGLDRDTPLPPMTASRSALLLDTRRTAVRRVDADYGSLPLVDARETKPGSGGLGFAIRRHRDARGDVARLQIHETVLAHFTVGSFEAFTGGPFLRSSDPPCRFVIETPPVPEALPIQARWEGFSLRTWSDAHLDVFATSGAFDAEKCGADPEGVLRARAAALVPGHVYAYRVAFREGRPAIAREELVVLFPHAVFVSAPANIAVVNGPFTQLTIPIHDGGATAATARISRAAIAHWSALRRGQRFFELDVEDSPEACMQLSVELEDAGDDPRLTLYFGLPEGIASAGFDALLQALEARAPG